MSYYPRTERSTFDCEVCGETGIPRTIVYLGGGANVTHEHFCGGDRVKWTELFGVDVTPPAWKRDD